jgi:DNA-directed RNA polymerase subunit K/omega
LANESLEDTDDEEDDDYLQKFDEDVRAEFISSNHPEALTNNYDEIKALTRVIRDKNNIIIDDLHTTSPFLSKYEKTRILGQRAKQLGSGAIPFVDNVSNILDNYIIACRELNERKLPFIIRRPMPNGGSEYWKLHDLEIL